MYAMASMIYTFSIWQKNNRVYRFLGIPANLLAICDSIFIKSISGLIFQSVVLISSTIGYFSHKENKEENSIVEEYDIKSEVA